jgi:hypothetical protein
MHWIKDGLGSVFVNQVWLIKTVVDDKVHVAPVSWVAPAGRDPVLVTVALRNQSITLKNIWRADSIELLPINVGVTGGNLVYIDSLPAEKRESEFIVLWYDLMSEPSASWLKAKFEYNMVCPGTHELVLVRIVDVGPRIAKVQKKEEVPASLLIHGVSSRGKAFGYFCWE